MLDFIQHPAYSGTQIKVFSLLSVYISLSGLNYRGIFDIQQ